MDIEVSLESKTLIVNKNDTVLELDFFVAKVHKDRIQSLR